MRVRGRADRGAPGRRRRGAFVGRVVETGSSSPGLLAFEVEQRVKGDVDERIAVRTPDRDRLRPRAASRAGRSACCSTRAAERRVARDACSSMVDPGGSWPREASRAAAADQGRGRDPDPRARPALRPLPPPQGLAAAVARSAVSPSPRLRPCGSSTSSSSARARWAAASPRSSLPRAGASRCTTRCRARSSARSRRCSAASRSSPRRAAPTPPRCSSACRPYDDLVPADLMIEAVVEDADVKKELFRTGRRDPPARGDPRLEHVVDPHHLARGGHGPTGAGDRHALLQPRAGAEARRGDPGGADVRRDRGRDRRARRGPREGAGRGARLPGLRLEPHPHAVPERGRVRAHGGRRRGRGDRHDREARVRAPARAARARGPDRARHLRRDHGGAARGPRRPEVRAVPAAAPVRRGRPARPEVRAAASTSTHDVDERLEAELSAHEDADEEFVERGLPLVAAPAAGPGGPRARARRSSGRERSRGRRSSTSSPRARSSSASASSTTRSRSDSGHARAASGSAGSRRRPGRTSGSSRSPGCSRASSRRDACSRSDTRSPSRRTSPGCCAPGVELVGVDLAEPRRGRDGDGRGRRPRRCRSTIDSFDQVLLVSTLEHVGADNTVLRARAPSDADGAGVRRAARAPPRAAARRQPARHRPARRAGRPRLVPAGGRARLDAAVRAGRASSSRSRRPTSSRPTAGARPLPFEPKGVRYGERGPAASAVLCAELRPGPAAAPRRPRAACGRRRGAAPRATYRRGRARDL